MDPNSTTAQPPTPAEVEAEAILREAANRAGDLLMVAGFGVRIASNAAPGLLEFGVTAHNPPR